MEWVAMTGPDKRIQLKGGNGCGLGASSSCGKASLPIGHGSNVEMEGSQTPHFLQLNRVILKACKLDPKERFASAEERHVVLLEIEPRPKQ